MSGRKLEGKAVRSKAVRLAAKPGLTIQDIANELGVGRNTLWREINQDGAFGTEFYNARAIGSRKTMESFRSRVFENLKEAADELRVEEDSKMKGALASEVRVLLGAMGRVDPNFSQKLDQTTHEPDKEKLTPHSEAEQVIADKWLKVRQGAGKGKTDV
jgi:transposase-like protein